MFIISKDLWSQVCETEIPVRLHSTFQNAVNFQSDKKMITFLSLGKCLQPSSVLFDIPIDFRTIDFPSGEMRLTCEGLLDNKRWIFRYQQLNVQDLELQNRNLLPLACSQVIREFLNKQEEKGIHGLIENRSDSVYTEFLRTRIETFRMSVMQHDAELIEKSVLQLAGCGPGLTPSSDDFLCGYMCALPQTARNKAICEKIAETASKKTNDISAALLQYAKERLYSADILNLFSAFRSGNSQEIEQALKQVAEFGSSSGCDFLTGMFYGILDTNKKEG